MKKSFYYRDGAATTHDYKRVTREDGMMRLECSCGKRSHWSEAFASVSDAQERHADDVAMSGR